MTDNATIGELRGDIARSNSVSTDLEALLHGRNAKLTTAVSAYNLRGIV